MSKFVLVASLLGGCIGWSKADTAMEVAFAGEQVLDLKQTGEAVINCEEANTIIGACGQNVSPQGYFLTTTLLHVMISAALPRYWRESFQGATLLSQGYNVYGNVATLRHNEMFASWKR